MTVDRPARPAPAMLSISWGGREWRFAPDAVVVVGRDSDADVQLLDDRISREHLEIAFRADAWRITDKASRNGTWRGQQRLAEGSEETLEGTLRLRLGALDGPELSLSAEPAATEPVARTITIGRSDDSDVVVGDPLASRRHAIVVTGARPVLRDVGSFNGTFLNGARVKGEVALAEGDTIGIGSTQLHWDGVSVAAPPPTAHRPVFSARHLDVTTKSGAHLMTDLSLTVPAGSLVAVVGPSGAGKSTLLGALTGLRPATSGRVHWNGRDLYAEYAQLRFLIGLVPQEDILHRQLTVRRALLYAARLRLPPDTTARECEERVRQVLEEVDLGKQIDQRIDSLSGGQRKRTSIALELLTAPQLLFLDEPTSGLDPGLDRQVMRSLRTLADAGRVVLVVTHSVLALDQCDRVLVLARGGRVAYFGPPDAVLSFFRADDYADAFASLEDEDWVERYDRSPAREAYVGRTVSALRPVPTAESPPPPRAAPVRQLLTLVRRNLSVVIADRLFVVLLIGMPMLLALMAHAFPGEAGLSVEDAQEEVLEVQQRLIVLVVGAALMGTALSIRELVVERPIFRREKAVGLSPTAYLLSKVIVLGLLVAGQCVLFTMLALLGLPGPDEARVLWDGRLEIAAAVAAVGFVMTIAALAISALATSTEQTMPALVALVMAQLILCGGLFALADRAVLEQISWVLPARFGYAAGAVTVGLQEDRPGVSDVDPLYEPTGEQWGIDMGLLGVQAVVFLGLAALALRRSVTRTPW